MRDYERRLLGTKLGLARLWLAIEAYWPALWPTAAVLGFFTAVSLFDPWADTPPWIRSLILIAILAAAAAKGYQGTRKLSLPSEKDARRRVEVETDLQHRPLDQIDDVICGTLSGSEPHAGQHVDQRTEALWKAHKNRAAVRPSRLKTGITRAGLQYRDPLAIRALLILLLFVGFAQAGPDWARRIDMAFTIDLSAQQSDARIDVWLTPPGYTGIAAITLEMAGMQGVAGSGDVIPASGVRTASSYTVPEGTTLSMRVEGMFRRPRLKLNGTRVDMSSEESTTDGTDVYMLEKTLLESSEIDLSAGNMSRGWRISIVPDQPPSIGFADTPDATNHHALRVRYTLNDDYGVEEATLDIRNSSGDETDAITISIAGARTVSRPASRTTYQDLTAHPWAGESIKAHLSAKDALGQVGQSDEISFVLPERRFAHPVAQKLIAVRKELFKTPDKRDTSSRRLERLSRQPSAFDSDLAVFTALRTAFWRLRWNDDARSLREVTSLLWDTAMHLEEGEVSVIESALRNLMEDAQRALSDDQSDQNFGAMADQIAQLMRDYLAAQMNRSEDAQRYQMEAGEMRSVGGDMLSRMLQQMKDLAAAGRKEEAMELLNQMRSMLENASPQQMDAEAYKRMMEGARALDAMEAIAREQQALLDQTSRERILSSVRKQLGSEVQSALPQMSADQKALGQRLEELTDKLKKNGLGSSDQLGQDQLAKAGQAMKQAARALRNNDGEDAQTSQQEALNALNEAIDKAGQQLSQQLVQLRQASPGNDPLGRPTGVAQDRIDIPDQSDMEEARRLLLELRDRLSDPSRDEEEIEYLRRLLRRF